MTEPCPWTDADVALLEAIYDLQCKSRMNALYYERRLSRLQSHSFWMEVITAATASGSGLAALTLFATDPGRWVWQALALIAAVIAVVRPIYAPSRKIEAFTRQQQGYYANYFDLKKLSFDIRQGACVTPEHRKRFDTNFDRHVQLSTEDEAPPDTKVIEEARKKTEIELPRANFWWPASASLSTRDAEGGDRSQQQAADLRRIEELQNP